MGNVILVTGGVRSGKSTYAEKLAEKKPSVTYIATAWAGDGEMEERIQLHRNRRPSNWQSVEEQVDLAGAILKLDTQCVLVDCLGMWVTNLLCQDGQDIEARVDELLLALNEFPGVVILVSNEVGWGLVPDNKLGRQFRDWLGIVNQRVAQISQDVFLLVAGCPVNIKALGGQDNDI